MLRSHIEVRYRADHGVQADGQGDGARLAQASHQKTGAHETGHRGAEGVDEIQARNGNADAPGTPHQLPNKQRQSSAHQRCRHQQQGKTKDNHPRKVDACGGGRSPVENAQGSQSKERDTEFGNTENQDSVTWKTRGEAPSDQAAETQAKHKSADDDRDGFGVHSIDGEEHSLPDDLIDQRGHSGKEEKDTDQQRLFSFLFFVKEKRGGKEESKIKNQQCQDYVR